MRFGITGGIPPASFDPVEHIDMNRCTVTIDAAVTNISMWNYEVSSWDGIRKHIASLPIQRPLWRIEETAGQRVWCGIRCTDIELAMPSAESDTGSLMSIDPWFSGAAVALRCELCGTTFQSLGSLVQHCRQKHTLRGTNEPIPVKDTKVKILPKNRFGSAYCNVPNLGAPAPRSLRQNTSYQSISAYMPGEVTPVENQAVGRPLPTAIFSRPMPRFTWTHGFECA